MHTKALFYELKKITMQTSHIMYIQYGNTHCDHLQW